MRKILLTGDKGFIASKVAKQLSSEGYEVEGFDIVDGKDLLSIKGLETSIERNDAVLHLAAEADLTKMQGDPQNGFEGVRKNVEATNNIAFLCSKHKKWLIFASTVCVYGNITDHPAREDLTLPNPSELYACSKYSAEYLIKGYGYNYNMPWTILRFATIYGPGMRSALGLHIFFSQALAGNPITVHGNGKQDRTLTYIDDLVEGIVATVRTEAGAFNQIINLSNDITISALQMAEDVQRITKTESKIVHIEQRDNQTFHEEISVEKARAILDWTAKTPWSEGLLKTYEWFIQKSS